MECNAAVRSFVWEKSLNMSFDPLNCINLKFPTRTSYLCEKGEHITRTERVVRAPLSATCSMRSGAIGLVNNPKLLAESPKADYTNDLFARKISTSRATMPGFQHVERRPFLLVIRNLLVNGATYFSRAYFILRHVDRRSWWSSSGEEVTNPERQNIS